MKLRFLLFAFILIGCQLEKSVILGTIPSTTPISSRIVNKTSIKSKTVEIGTKQSTSSPSTVVISIDDGKELIIQCKNLMINQPVQFSGKDVTVIIEYEKLKSNYSISTAVGVNGIYRLEKKEIEF